MIHRTVLVAGCGFLGIQVARLFHQEKWDVLGLVHSPETAHLLDKEGFPVLAYNIANPEAIERLAASGRDRFDVVIHCASSGKGELEDYRRVYLGGTRNLLKSLTIGQMIFTSSTSVYAQTNGAWIAEESSAEPGKETGRVLRETEQMVLARDGVVLRLSALYGPGRSVLLRKFFAGEAVIEGDGSRWINQIHRDDAASAFLQVVKKEAFGIYNVSDDYPVSQATLYEFLAKQFQRPLPPYGEVNLNKKRGVSDKRIANAKLRTLGWRPNYPSFFDALEQDPWIAAAARPEGME